MKDMLACTQFFLCVALVAAGLVVFTGCTHRGATVSGRDMPQAASQKASVPLPEQEAIRVAKNAAIQARIRLDDYEEPDARRLSGDAKGWFVFFPGRFKAPGNHFAVAVDDRTRSTKIIPGE